MKPGEEYCELQPKDGEMVLFCRHIELLADCIKFHGLRLHWIASESPDAVVYTDLDTGQHEAFMARWICLCEECFLKDPVDFSEIAQHAPWIGDEPIIVREVAS
jgi:hypothetical protein